MDTRILVVALLICLPISSGADLATWQWNFDHETYLGTSLGASDGYDSSDRPMDSSGHMHTAIYHASGVDGWDGPTGFYAVDMRSPLETASGSTKTWRMYLWGDLSLNPQWTDIGTSWFGSGVSADAFQQIQYRLTYVRSAVGIADERVGMSMVLNDWPDGSSWWFPAYRTDNGLNGYVLDLTATAVPEPSSLAVLGIGMLPLAGVAIKRMRAA